MNKNEIKIFDLYSEKSFKEAEKYKSKLENKGYKVITENYGFNGVKISGVL